MEQKGPVEWAVGAISDPEHHETERLRLARAVIVDELIHRMRRGVTLAELAEKAIDKDDKLAIAEIMGQRPAESDKENRE